MKSRFKAIILVIMSILFLACTGILLSPCPNFSKIALDERPDFIVKAWPLPNTKLSLGCYTRKSLLTLTQWEWLPGQEKNRNTINSDGWIGVRLFSKVLASEMSSGFSGRTSFFVDKKEVRYFLRDDGSMNFEYDEVTQMPKLYQPEYYVGYGKLFLFPGKHTARIMITKMDSTILEYEWSFEITWW